MTWTQLRETQQKLHVGVFEAPAGRFRRRTELTAPSTTFLTAPRIDPPNQIIELAAPTPAGQA
jgi:hypothetical protein